MRERRSDQQRASSDRREVATRVVVAGVIAVAGGIITEYVVGLQHERRAQQAQVECVQELALLRARLEGELWAALHLTRGLIAWTRATSSFDDAEFEAIAREVVRGSEVVRNIALAPDNTIRYVFPVEGNEAAIGVRYDSIHAQWPSILEAMRVGDTVVAGPVDLIQGGQGIIARTPVYVAETGAADEDGRFWGMASIVLEVPVLYERAGVNDSALEGRLAIRGRDGRGADGEVFLGSAERFRDGSPTLDVMLPAGSWQLALAPNAVRVPGLSPLSTRILGSIFSMLFSALVFLLLRARQHSRILAMYDALTGVPNLRETRHVLRQRAERARVSGSPFGVIVLDIDGFKRVNDSLGHGVGDELLVELADRLERHVGKSGLVGRVGGDEFLVMLDAITGEATLALWLGDLRRALTKPMNLGGAPYIPRVSLGGAVWGLDAEDLGELLRVADLRMYEEKRCSVAEGESETSDR